MKQIVHIKLHFKHKHTSGYPTKDYFILSAKGSVYKIHHTQILKKRPPLFLMNKQRKVLIKCKKDLARNQDNMWHI